MESKTIYGDVMRGNQRFSYVLVITKDEWRARVFRADGAFHGWAACGVMRPPVDEDEGESKARNWIEHCLVYQVGLD